MSKEEIKDFVNDVLDGNLLDARNSFKEIMAQKKREKELELYNQADEEFMTVKNDESL